jgi:outer membrane protein assembly factor BamD (BamD/ComL family)
VLLRARRALSRHDAGQALAALERHRRRWPRGELLQEREVLAIQALSLAGSRDEARRRADAFLARFPTSTLAATVRQLRASAEE